MGRLLLQKRSQHCRDEQGTWDCDCAPLKLTFVYDVMNIMTPEKAKRINGNHAPSIINIDNFPSFDDLLGVRDSIRRLQLVPYRRNRFYLGPQLFPSLLPPLLQRVMWIKNPHENDKAIAHSIASIMIAEGLTLDDIILFENPHGSIQVIRHVHVLTRGEEELPPQDMYYEKTVAQK